MSEETEGEQEAPKKPSKLPLILGLVLALVGGGGGFYATWSGMILAPGKAQAAATTSHNTSEIDDIGFVAMDPLVITLSDTSPTRHLRFRSQLEVPKPYVGEVEALMPRVVDVLNTYLRALRTEDFEKPAALTRLRAQILRRFEIVLGSERINDVLIMEFVIN